jgi:hypothetical protein
MFRRGIWAYNRLSLLAFLQLSLALERGKICFYLIICGLFNDAVGTPNCIVSYGRMISEQLMRKDVKGSSRSPSICLEGLRKTTKSLGQDSGSPGPDLNTRFPEYEAAVFPFPSNVRCVAEVTTPCITVLIKFILFSYSPVVYYVQYSPRCCVPEFKTCI